MQIEGNTVGDKVVEGKTKIVYRLADNPDKVLLHSKDRITAGDGERAHDLKGKAEISTTTASAIFEMLNNAGIKSHFIKRSGQTCMVCNYCDMVPLEFVTRRIATGSFLKRNPGVKEGYRFCPPKQEIFFKDDANHDPQWSYEQCVEAKLEFGGRLIGRDEIDIMCKSTVTVFEVLEKAWASLDCSLIDMKIEFGVNPKTGEILLADIIDSDSWRLWPAGDRRLMKDKQVYRELREVTSEALDTVKRNFEWVADRVGQLSPKPSGRAVVFMGSPTDMAHCEKIRAACKLYGVPCELRVSSAHKGTDETKNILAQYEGEGIPTVFIAVAGRSNGLGPVLSGNAAWPVINCPPISADWGAEDIWSSLRLPSGLGCTTVTSPDGAALAAAQILCLNDHMIWAKLRTKQLNTWVGLKEADIKARKTNFMIEKSEVFQNGH
ncbi:multifunctional protein ADE2-like [Mya arenaria]|uniref:multifunctional protein ADE2-like n=1 Tax=Mya arenaria TaxID=6604 RepID=UPI0022DF1A72|nr:multifunctional protein ADE2-like [Mya arenaria]